MNHMAITAQGVCKRYEFFALQDVALNVATGTIMGLIGPNGAGKSTTIRILLGLIHQDRGEVRVLGHHMPEQQIAAKWDVGFASDDMRLYGPMTLEWHMNFIKSIYESWDARYARQLLTRFGLRAEQKIKGFSHGQRVKAALLLLFARRPKVLVLDEPTTGLDPIARHEVLRELSDVMATDDRTILFSSQNTQDVEQISDGITFIDRGRIIDSMDKETYLDRWRRLRMEIPPGASIPALPGIVDIRRTGRLAVAITDDFAADIPYAFECSGAHVQAVENMTLEEIFVATVQRTREEAKA